MGFLHSNAMKETILEATDALTSLPSRFHTQYLTNNADQQHRGTCWAFASIAALESGYMKFGAENGYLKDKEWVKLSEQSYAIGIMEFCKKYPEKCPDTPKIGDKASASDGYIIWVWAMQNYLRDKILPDLESCPYTPDEGHDLECPGRKDALKRGQKSLLKDKFIPIVIELAWTPYYVPCEGDNAGLKGCDEEHRVKCPADIAAEYCFVIKTMTDEEGHFFYTHRPGHHMEHVGGHAVGFVGYNDDYVWYSSEGEEYKGGFILKNSWGPDVSHSVRHFMNYGSYRYEDEICPNERAFSKWVPCGNNPTGGDDLFKLKNTTVLKCADEKPGHLHVVYSGDKDGKLDEIKKAVCSEEHRYCIADSLPLADGSVSVTVRKWTTDPKVYEEQTLPQIPPVAMSMIFQPEKVNVENSIEHCGYNFYPYKLWEETQSKWMSWGLDLEFEFSRASYVSQKSSAKKGMDYQFIEKVTKTIPDVAKPKSPIPWISEVF
ncbi:hypothetical protein GEMRC1_000570 [Eukaryota sp. GEM-RC1]